MAEIILKLRRLFCSLVAPSQRSSIPIVSPHVSQLLTLDDWRAHRFGLSPSLWESLTGKCFWVTGGGSGYGRAIAIALLASGCEVFVTGRSQEKLNSICTLLSQAGIQGDRYHPLPADLSQTEQIDRACQIIRDTAPELTGLVHCAAMLLKHVYEAPLCQMQDEEWQDMLDLNLMAAVRLARGILPQMLNSGGARILFLTSEAGWADTPGMGPYNVTKAALNSFCASFAAECSVAHPQRDIQVNVLDPGEAGTEMNQASHISPFAAVPMTLRLLAQPEGGPNGRFFHRDGRHLGFAYAEPFDRVLVQ